MMTGIVVYGMHGDGHRQAIDGLSKQGIARIDHWIGVNQRERRFDLDIRRWHMGRLPVGSHRLARSGPSRHIFDAVADCLPAFVDQVSRNPCCRSAKPQDYYNLFGMLVDAFFALLDEKASEFLLMQNLPHEGMELVLYRVAQAMGIPTLLLHQSLFPNRFFYCYSLDDFGSFQTAEMGTPAEAPVLPRQFQKDLFYMPQRPDGPSTHLLGIESRAKQLLKRCRVMLPSRFWYDGPTRFRRQEIEYRRSIARRAQSLVDLNRKFVYFPLHLQPELTTSSLGRMYTDQLLAVERLSQMLPRDWWIYVKENPKQTFRQRSASFFQRLRQLRRVVLVAPEVDTYLLMQHCQLVATISGTAGWEAITGGRRVLVFGRPWYRWLPGVHAADNPLALEAVSQCPIDHEQLKLQLCRLLAKTRPGVVDPAYAQIVPDYSTESNAQLLFQFLARQLQRRGELKRCA